MNIDFQSTLKIRFARKQCKVIIKVHYQRDCGSGFHSGRVQGILISTLLGKGVLFVRL